MSKSSAFEEQLQFDWGGVSVRVMVRTDSIKMRSSLQGVVNEP